MIWGVVAEDPRRAAANALLERVIALRDELAPRFPDMDPGDLMLIIEMMLRPLGSGRRWFLTEIRPGVYVP